MQDSGYQDFSTWFFGGYPNCFLNHDTIPILCCSAMVLLTHLTSYLSELNRWGHASRFWQEHQYISFHWWQHSPPFCRLSSPTKQAVPWCSGLPGRRAHQPWAATAAQALNAVMIPTARMTYVLLFMAQRVQAYSEKSHDVWSLLQPFFWIFAFQRLYLFKFS